MAVSRVNVDELAENRRLAFDVGNATDDGMGNAPPEDGTSRETAGQQRSGTRKRMQRKDTGKARLHGEHRRFLTGAGTRAEQAVHRDDGGGTSGEASAR